MTTSTSFAEQLQAKISSPLEAFQMIAKKIDALGGTGGAGVAVADLATPTTNVTPVPGSFADLAAVNSYLSTAVPIIETRLDNLEAKLNAALDSLRGSGQIAP